MTKIFLARQPILDRDQSVEGYELLYPQPKAGEPPVRDEALATARVALGAVSDIGLEHIVGQSRAWIQVSPEFLDLDLVGSLPPGRVVLELQGAPFDDPAVIDHIAELRSTGYPLALASFAYSRELE